MQTIVIAARRAGMLVIPLDSVEAVSVFSVTDPCHAADSVKDCTCAAASAPSASRRRTSVASPLSAAEISSASECAVSACGCSALDAASGASAAGAADMLLEVGCASWADACPSASNHGSALSCIALCMILGMVALAANAAGCQHLIGPRLEHKCGADTHGVSK